jgi:aminomethyltransferase
LRIYYCIGTQTRVAGKRSLQMHKTCLYEQHLQHKAHIVEFAGYRMPMHYGSQIAEHNAVRSDAGIFDVSHMGVIAVSGAEATEFLLYVCAADIAKCQPGRRARYSCLLNENAGIIDDLIVYKLDANYYQLVVNASRKLIDLQHLKKYAANFAVEVTLLNDYAILACQGPNAIKYLSKLTAAIPVLADITNLPRFDCHWHGNYCVARTGYTGADGCELIFPASDASKVWDLCIQQGFKPCGLGARDSLRLEAGYNLYGSDMDERHTPDAVNLAWTVHLDATRDFVGKEKLLSLRAQSKKILYPVLAQDKGIIRIKQKVYSDGKEIGAITGAVYSPSLEKFIAFAHLYHLADNLYVENRDRKTNLSIVELPFVAL